MLILLTALVGLLTGPLVHHMAVQIGADRALTPLRVAYGEVSARVVATSLTHGALWGMFTWSLGPTAVLLAYLGFASMTLALFITDLDHKRIPNRITYPGTPLLALVLMVGAAVDGRGSEVIRGLAGALVYTTILFVVFLVARGGFGFGDVKLAVSLGLFVTFVGWRDLYVAGLLTAFIGAVVAVAVVVAGRGGAKTELPYGPPMILGAWITLLGGSSVTGFFF